MPCMQRILEQVQTAVIAVDRAGGVDTVAMCCRSMCVMPAIQSCAHSTSMLCFYTSSFR